MFIILFDFILVLLFLITNFDSVLDYYNFHRYRKKQGLTRKLFHCFGHLRWLLENTQDKRPLFHFVFSFLFMMRYLYCCAFVSDGCNHFKVEWKKKQWNEKKTTCGQCPRIINPLYCLTYFFYLSYVPPGDGVVLFIQ